MLAHHELRILQYSVQKSREVVLASLFQDPGVLEYDILAIQEPWRNPYVYTSYHPLKTHFQLAYLADATTRVCLYINKRLDPSTWRVSYVSKDIISLTIRNPTSGRSIHIVNVYNEVGTDTLNKLRETISALDPPDRTVLLGDFNLHHPIWSAKRQRSGEGQSAQELITLTEDFQLQLLTVPGTPTHRWKGGESTIDLTFASEDLAPQIIHCKIDRSLDHDSDHLPITLAIDWSWQPAAPTGKRMWAKTDVTKLRRAVQDRLPRTREAAELGDEDSIDNFVSVVVGDRKSVV